MQPSIQEKQQYLRQQILQSNFDPEEFVNFLRDDLQMNQLDVEHLSMKVIEQIVLKFKQYKYYKSQQSQSTAVYVAPLNKIKVCYDKKEGIYDYEFQQLCPCVHADSFNKNVQIEIPAFELKQKEGAFFSLGSKTQIWYIVKTNLTQQPVKRLQQHFEWLSCTVARLFALQAIPELIPIAKEYESNTEKRRRQLQNYLQILAQREELKRSNLFLEFLTVPAEKMEKWKKNCDSLGFAKGVQSIKNESGQVSVSITNKLRDYAQNISSYVKKINPIHEAITGSFEKVTEILNAAFLQLNKIVECYAQMHECYNELSNKFPEEKISEQNQVFININNLFSVLSNNLCATSKVINSNLKQFYKISNNYDKSITKLYRNLVQTEKEYVNFKTHLHRKKQRLYPDVSKWEVDQKKLENRRLNKEEAFSLMLPKQTQQEQDQRLWLGYLHTNYSQFRKYIQFSVKRYKHVFCNFTSEILQGNKAYVEDLTKFLEETHKVALS